MNKKKNPAIMVTDIKESSVYLKAMTVEHQVHFKPVDADILLDEIDSM